MKSKNNLNKYKTIGRFNSVPSNKNGVVRLFWFFKNIKTIKNAMFCYAQSISRKHIPEAKRKILKVRWKNRNKFQKHDRMSIFRKRVRYSVRYWL